MLFRQLFDPDTSTYTYLLADEASREAILIDTVREQHERDATLIDELGLDLVATLETHVHADHVTGAWLHKQRFGSDIVYPAPSGVDTADRLVGEGDEIRFGPYALEVRRTPGHTDSCVTYVCQDRMRAFTGDALLIRGSGRTDFQQGDAATLYRSVWDQILSLPDEAQLYPGHDYKGRTVTTVAEEKAFNARLGGGRTEDDFVGIMANLRLAYPRKIDVALPGNMAMGRYPEDDEVAAPEPVRDVLADVPRTAAGVRHVTTDWVAAHMSAVRIVDVRQPVEFDGPLGHIDGAELVPLSELLDATQGWDRNQAIVTVCRSSGRSDRAAMALEARGFHHVASMTGGMLMWSNQQVAAASCG